MPPWCSPSSISKTWIIPVLGRTMSRLSIHVLLVLGAAGGVGLSVVQIGNVCGAIVIAVARGSEKRDLLKSLGVDHVVDSTSGSTIPNVKEFLKSRNIKGVDVLYDPLGGKLLKDSLKLLNGGANILVIGFASGEIPVFPANITLVKVELSSHTSPKAQDVVQHLFGCIEFLLALYQSIIPTQFLKTCVLYFFEHDHFEDLKVEDSTFITGDIAIGWDLVDAELNRRVLTIFQNWTVHGLYLGSYKIHQPEVLVNSMQELLSWFAKGMIHVNVSHTYRLSEVLKASCHEVRMIFWYYAFTV
eukprot:Gb_29254 [translate_table: standard]